MAAILSSFAGKMPISWVELFFGLAVFSQNTERRSEHALMSHRIAVAIALLFLLGGWITDDVPLPRGLDPRGIDEDCVPRASRTAPVSGRTIGALDRESCERILRDQGIHFENISPEHARGVAHPIRLTSLVNGVRIAPDEGVHSVIDCRLAVALAAWAPDLRALGVVGIDHVSIYRPGAHVRGTRHVSGHAHALAIDALAFVLSDGRRLSVLESWSERDAGADPCALHENDDDATRKMRSAVCTAVQRDLFQVVLTPHHDAAHSNHVHLEIRPGVDWTFVR